MQEYTNNLNAKLSLNIISLVLFVSFIFLTIYTSFSNYYIYTTNRLYLVSIFLLIASGIYLRTHPHLSKVQIDERELFFYRRNCKQVVENSLIFAHVKRISRVYNKHLNKIGPKIILIETKFNEITITVNHYKKHKELLAKIIDNISKTTDVRIPYDVKELIN